MGGPGGIQVRPSGRRDRAGLRLAVWLLSIGLGGWLLFAASRGPASTKLLYTGKPTPYDQQPIVVSVYEYGFTPAHVSILTGQVVTWRNVGKQLHQIRPITLAGQRVFAAAERIGSANHLFETPGRYPYYCAFHNWMRGVVEVRARR
jgi:plastocyanin